MTSGGEKCGALVGEKSQTVHSANWKLDAMLQREKQMLDVSKRRVEHRITMDKQVVRKRFHMKLHRSKLHHARMTGNTEMLQKLLLQGNFDNNYGAGNDDSLNINPGEKPSRNIKSASARLIRAKEREMRSTVSSRLGNKSKIIKQEDSLVQEKVKCPNAGKEMERKLSVVTKPIDGGTQRSSPVQTKRLQNRNTSKRCVQKIRPVTAPGIKTTADPLNVNKTNLLPHKNELSVGTRPKTAIGAVATTNDRPEEIKLPVSCNSTNASAPKTDDQDTKSNHGTSSIFIEKPKLTLIDVQMARIRRANFSNRIKSFTESIPSHLKVDRRDVIDLYSAGLVDKVNIDQDGTRMNNAMSEIESEVERQEELRSIGNINAPNMTFKELNTNYGNTKSECIETVPFLRKSSGLAGMLRHHTISKLSIPSTAWESDEEDFSD